jgi:hypothetical protein
LLPLAVVAIGATNVAATKGVDNVAEFFINIWVEVFGVAAALAATLYLLEGRRQRQEAKIRERLHSRLNATRNWIGSATTATTTALIDVPKFNSNVLDFPFIRTEHRVLRELLSGANPAVAPYSDAGLRGFQVPHAARPAPEEPRAGVAGDSTRAGRYGSTSLGRVGRGYFHLPFWAHPLSGCSFYAIKSS